jgi:hypothetical protein
MGRMEYWNSGTWGLNGKRIFFTHYSIIPLLKKDAFEL